MTHHRPLARREPGFRTQKLRAVARYPDRLLRDAGVRVAVIDEPRRVVESMFRSFEMHVAVGERVGDCLVLTDSAAEHDAVFGV